jgi:hypothetical protein
VGQRGKFFKMAKWFVSTARRLPGSEVYDVVWTAEEFETEEMARTFASSALVEGLRVEAGTVSGGLTTVRVCWREAAAWAASERAARQTEEAA